MDILDKKETGQMNHLQAWAHFYAIWIELPPLEKRRVPQRFRWQDIRTAQADYLGKRRNGRGEVISLGTDRVARILQVVSNAMPETFAYIYHPPVEEWFEVGQ